MQTAKRRSVVLVLGLATAWAAASATIVQTSPAGAQGEFTSGAGMAKASLITPTVAAGNLAVSVLLGQSTAAYRDRSAIGTSVLLDVPAVRIASGTSVCGRLGADLGSALPPAVVADTATNGDSKPVVVPSATQGQLVHQSASAAPEARSASETGLGTLGLGPLASVVGARATASSVSDAAAGTRTAAAHSEIGQVDLLGGLLSVRGLRWDLEQSVTGPDSRSSEEQVDAGFSLGALSIGLPGLPRVELPVPSSADLGRVVDAANGLLAPLGVQLRLPTVTADPDAGSHTVTPLTIALGGRAWLGAPLIGAIANEPSFQQLSKLLSSTLFDPQGCNELGGLLKRLSPDLSATYNSLGSSFPLLLAVITGALGGTGEVQLNVGGVETRIDDAYYPPLGFAPPAMGPTGAPVPGIAGSPALSGEPEQAAAGAEDLPPAVAASTRCSTTSPAGRPGCWLGRAPLAAGIAVTFTTALLGLDEGFRRRGRTRSKGVST